MGQNSEWDIILTGIILPMRQNSEWDFILTGKFLPMRQNSEWDIILTGIVFEWRDIIQKDTKFWIWQNCDWGNIWNLTKILNEANLSLQQNCWNWLHNLRAET